VKIGDLVQPNKGSSFMMYRVAYFSEELPWNDRYGLEGEIFTIPLSSVGFILDEKTINPRNALGEVVEQRRFLRIVFPQGIGWVPESWMKDAV